MTLQIGTFGGASAFPVLVAKAQSLFAHAGLDVSRTLTRDSGRLRDGLTEGALDIAHLAPDNVIAWADDEGSSVRAWLGGSNGPISLLARGARSIPELRGGRVGVDSPRSGFVPILRQLLRSGGLVEGDVELVSLGATRLRFAALEEGSVDATMLTLPWSRLARRSGATSLGDHADVAPHLLTSCAASLGSWLDANESLAVRYAETIDAAVAWLHDPSNQGRATALLAQDMEIHLDIAAEVLAAMMHEASGWPARSRLSGTELAPTWDLRAETVGRPAATAESYVRVLPQP